MHCRGDEGDADCFNSDDDRRTSSGTPDDDDDVKDENTLASCFDFRLLSRAFDVNPTNSSTFTRHSFPSLLTRILCSDSESSVRYSTDNSSTSSSNRCGSGKSVSPPPLFVGVLQSPSVQQQSVIGGNGDSLAHDCWQVPADDVTDHVAAHRRTLMTSRYGQKQRSQQQQQQTMLIAGWTYFVQPDESSSSSSGLYRKRTSFHHEVQVIKIDQTQRVCRDGAALSRHTEELHQSDLVD